VPTFLTQRTASYCGVATSVMALNALPIAAPAIEGLAPFRGFTEDNVFNEAARRGCTPESVSKGGMTVDQVVHLLNSNGARAQAHFADQAGLDEFRMLAAANLASGGDFVLVDFLRTELGQDFGAHWSALAAYHEGSDRFLVLDVARFRYLPYWASAADLHRAMNTADPDSGKRRGFVEVRKAEGAAPRVEIPPLAHRMMKLALGAGAGIFAVGLVVGLLVGRRLGRRKTAISHQPSAVS
jgi:hypothetical protein